MLRSTARRERVNIFPLLPTSACVSAESMEATLTMIHEKSERVLEPLPHRALLRAVADYAAGRAPVDVLMDTAHQLMDTEQKVT